MILRGGRAHGRPLKEPQGHLQLQGVGDGQGQGRDGVLWCSDH